MTDREAIEYINDFVHEHSYNEELYNHLLSALQEREERSNGCKFCTEHADMRLCCWEDRGYTVCPYCGRPLKGRKQC